MLKAWVDVETTMEGGGNSRHGRSIRTLLDAYASREAEVMEAGRMREALETIADNCSAFMLSSDPGDIIPAECGVIARAALSPEPEAKET